MKVHKTYTPASKRSQKSKKTASRTCKVQLSELPFEFVCSECMAQWVYISGSPKLPACGKWRR
jgi:hypothetical protein